MTPAPLHLPFLLHIYLSVLVSSFSALKINVIQQKIEAESSNSALSQQPGYLSS